MLLPEITYRPDVVNLLPLGDGGAITTHNDAVAVVIKQSRLPADLPDNDTVTALRSLLRSNLDELFADPTVTDEIATVAQSVLAQNGSGECKPRALLVDDNSGLLFSVGAYLEHSGYDVVRTTSGEEAMAELGAGVCFDILITDRSCLDEIGDEVLAHAEELSPAPHMIVLSDRFAPEPVVEADNVISFDGWLEKQRASRG